MRTHEIYYQLDRKKAYIVFAAIRKCISQTLRTLLRSENLMQSIYSDVFSESFFVEPVIGDTIYNIATRACYRSLRDHGFHYDDGIYFGDTVTFDIYGMSDEEREKLFENMPIPQSAYKEEKNFCPECGREFKRTHNRQIYCSDTCLRASRSKRRKKARNIQTITIFKTCPACNKSFIAERKSQIYCSDKCYNRAWQKERKNEICGNSR